MKIKKFIGALAGVTMLCASLPFSSTTVDFVKDSVLTAHAATYARGNVIFDTTDGINLLIKGSGDMGNTGKGSDFQFANSINSVVIGNGIESISDYAFEKFTSLTSIQIPSTVKRIGAHAFDGCTNLESITIPSSVIEIDEDAFKGTKWLANRRKESNNVVVVNGILADGKACSGDVVVPNSVKIISQYAFRGCKNLNNVTIPNTITQIETTPFDGCNKLQNIYYTGTQQEWESIKIDYRRQVMNATHKFDAKYNYSGDKKDKIVIEAGKVIADISETRSVRVPISVFNNTGFATSSLKFTFDDGVYAVGVESGLLTPSADISPYGDDTVIVKTNSGTNKNGVIYYLDVELPSDKVGSTYNVYMDSDGFTTSSGVDPVIYLNNPDKTDAEKKIKAVTITVTDKAKSVVTINQASNPTTTQTPAPKPAENIMLGDVNKDNSVDSKDAVLVLKSYAESLVGGNSSIDTARADVNKDGKVDSKDAVIILKYYAASLVGNAGDITKY